MRYKVDENSAGQRIDKFLSEKMAKFSRAQIQKMIKNNLVMVGDKNITPHYKVKNGDIIKVSKIKESKSKPGPVRGVKIIKETDDYLIINKPAGLLVHADAVHDENTLVDWLIEKYTRIKRVYDKQNKTGKMRLGIVHRLDRDVSGLLVVAKKQKMLDHLKDQFKSRKIDKEYTALVYGNIELDSGEITRAIARSKKTGLMVARSTNQEDGKTAITQFEVLQRFTKYTLVKIKLITGRTHQIRVHLKSIGHSVVSDKLYTTRNIKSKKPELELDRIFLCATQLGFKDLAGEWVKAKIKLPKNLTDFLKSLK